MEKAINGEAPAVCSEAQRYPLGTGGMYLGPFHFEPGPRPFDLGGYGWFASLCAGSPAARS